MILPPLVQQLVDFHYSEHRVAGHYATHLHPYCQLDVMLGGAMTVNAVDPTIRLAEGEGVLVPPFVTHGYDVDKSALHATYKFYVHPRYGDLLGKEIRRVCFEPIHLAISHQVSRQKHVDSRLADHNRMSAATMCLVHVLSNATSSIQEVALDGDWLDLLWEVLDEVTARPEVIWSVAELADRCCVSLSYFTRQFSRRIGQTPQQFLLEVRMRAAAEQLGHSTTSIKTIAHAAGYASVHSFTRAFKKIIGSNPGAFRKTSTRL